MKVQSTPNGALGWSSAILGMKYRQPGYAYGPGMAVAHALACLKKTHYDDNEDVRLRRHVILYGPPGSSKSHASKFFLTKLIGGIDLLDPANNQTILTSKFPSHPNDPPQPTFPTFAIISGSSSFERIRGTFGAGGDIMAPILQEADWIYASELLSFLGHNPNERAKRIEDMNGILEEGTVAVTLAKAGNMPLADRIEMAADIPIDAGYTYDPHRSTLRYDCTVSFLGCTRRLSEPLLKELADSGYWSRHSVEEYRPAHTAARRSADNKFGGKIPKESVDACRAKWLDLWNTEFTHVNAPPEKMTRSLVLWYNTQLDEIVKETGVLFDELSTNRDDTDLMQLLTASAVEQISISREVGDRSPVEKLLYTERDLTRAKEWTGGRLFHIRCTIRSRLEGEEPVKEPSFVALEAFVNSRDSKPDPDEFHSNTLVKFLSTHDDKTLKTSERTARRTLTELREKGHIVAMRTQPGEYYVESAAMRKMGYVEIEGVWTLDENPDEPESNYEQEEEEIETA